MWRLQRRNTAYPLISGAGTTVLLAFLAVSTFLQVAAIGGREQAGKVTTGEEQSVTTASPRGGQAANPEFSLAFSNLGDTGAHRNN